MSQVCCVTFLFYYTTALYICLPTKISNNTSSNSPAFYLLSRLSAISAPRALVSIQKKPKPLHCFLPCLLFTRLRFFSSSIQLFRYSHEIHTLNQELQFISCHHVILIVRLFLLSFLLRFLHFYFTFQFQWIIFMDTSSLFFRLGGNSLKGNVLSNHLKCYEF